MPPVIGAAGQGRVELGAHAVVPGARQNVQAGGVVLPAAGRHAVEAEPFDRCRLDGGVEAELVQHRTARCRHGNVQVDVHDVGGEAEAILAPLEVPQEAEVEVA